MGAPRPGPSRPRQRELLDQVADLGDRGPRRVDGRQHRRGGDRETGGGGEQLPGVGVLRPGEQLGRGALLDDPTVPHHDDPVGPVGGDGEVVGDQQQRGAPLAAQRVEVVEDPAGDGRVQRAGRLVGDDQRGSGGEGDRDEHPLAHPAGQLVGVLPGAGPRIVETGRGQQLDGAGRGRAAVGEPVGAQALGDLHTDLLHGVQRDARVLRDEPDPGSAHRPVGALGQPGEDGAVECDRARGDRPCGGQQPEHRGGQGGLARPGLPDDGDDLPGRDGQVDAAHGVHRPATGGVGDLQTRHLQQGAHADRLHSPSRARAIRLTDSTVAAMTRPGIAHTHQATAR